MRTGWNACYRICNEGIEAPRHQGIKEQHQVNRLLLDASMPEKKGVKDAQGNQRSRDAPPP
jgi:hypothetical protein